MVPTVSPLPVQRDQGNILLLCSVFLPQGIEAERPKPVAWRHGSSSEASPAALHFTTFSLQTSQELAWHEPIPAKAVQQRKDEAYFSSAIAYKSQLMHFKPSRKTQACYYCLQHAFYSFQGLIQNQRRFKCLQCALHYESGSPLNSTLPQAGCRASHVPTLT